MVKRETLLKYGALALILFFVFEAFFPLLFTANASATPVPSVDPSALSFTASVTANVLVVALTDLALGACASSDVDLESIRAFPEVSQAFFASDSLLTVRLKANASTVALEDYVAKNCLLPLYRSAILDVPALTLNTSNQGEQFLSRRQMQAFAQSQGLSGLQGFVSAKAVPGQTVNATVQVAVQNNALAAVTIQQLESDVAASGPVFVDERSANATESSNASVSNVSTASPAGNASESVG
ncbi:hypothetical protein HY572_04210 [Candidatus Micrarchaeota archaeon]|nr:hypothetical protein [Candidatus Micrarchaeota archaeon]